MSGIGVLATFAYDDLGRRSSLTRGNGTATRYRYDPVSRLDELKLDYAGTADDLTSEFAYNPASQIASTLRSNDAYAWTSHGSGTISTTANGRNQIAGWVSMLGYGVGGTGRIRFEDSLGASATGLIGIGVVGRECPQPASPAPSRIRPARAGEAVRNKQGLPTRPS